MMPNNSMRTRGNSAINNGVNGRLNQAFNARNNLASSVNNTVNNKNVSPENVRRALNYMAKVDSKLNQIVNVLSKGIRMKPKEFYYPGLNNSNM
jgi:hypothetical protein